MGIGDLDAGECRKLGRKKVETVIDEETSVDGEGWTVRRFTFRRSG